VPRLDPDRLLQQAELLAAHPPSGEPHQTDLRRAISSAYYGVFHFTLASAADMVVGTDNRSTARYSLAYRSVDHARLRTLCSQLKASQMSSDLSPYVPAGGFGEIIDFARLAANLLQLRNLADYHPSELFTIDEARAAVSEAREAIRHFQAANEKQQQVFLTLLLFRPR
jgi:hypothetical protein